MNEVGIFQPKSVLDLGSGWGLYGAALRQVLDIGPMRVAKEDWKTRIVGVEGFESYISPIHYYVYDKIYCNDFTNTALWTYYTGFDLVLMVDSLEHVERSVGVRLLDWLIRHNKRVIVSCPFGHNYLEQGAVNGNELERHLTHWTVAEMQMRGGRILHKGVCFVASFRGENQ
jgi:2-polyprenyl-3-methyl-5-hydroxy-6-metoxy-1,4-benzoquinol methylase